MFIATLHFQSFVYIHPQNCEMSKAVITAPSLSRRQLRRGEVQWLFQSHSPSARAPILLALSPMFHRLLTLTVKGTSTEMSSGLKLRQFPFRPLIIPFLCFSATCSFSPSLPAACLLARKEHQLSDSAGLWHSRHQVESLSEVNPNDYLRDSISFREGTLSVQSTVEFVVLMNWSIL